MDESKTAAEKLEELQALAEAGRAADAANVAAWRAWYAEHGEERSRRWEERRRETHARAGRAGAAKRWAGHDRSETVQIRVWPVAHQVLRMLGKRFQGGVPHALHAILAQTAGVLWQWEAGVGGKAVAVPLAPLRGGVAAEWRPPADEPAEPTKELDVTAGEG